MFRLMLLLCATIFAVLLVGGRDHGQVRYGLIPGKIAPLVPARTADAEVIEVAAAAPVEAVVTAKVAASAEPVAEAAPVVTTASFDPEASTEAQGGLTLSLPLVEPGAEPVAVETEAEALPEPEPEVQYVVGTSVNVRQGPSAETESLTKLARGEAVLVLPSDMPGWSKIRIEGDGVEGFIATRFLSGTPETSLFNVTD